MHLNRSTKLAQVFVDNTAACGSNPNTDSSKDMKESFYSLEKLLISELKTWWDHNSLKMYIEKNMIPRGLRLKKTPTTVYTDTFTSKWNEILSTCSLSLMDLIVTHEMTKLQSLESEIIKIQDNLKVFADKEDFSTLQDNVMKNVDKLETNIMQIKKAKFQRDLDDYNKKQVYPWSKTRWMSTPKSILKGKKQRKRRMDSHVSFNSTEFDTQDASQSMDMSHFDRPRTRSTSNKNNTGQIMDTDENFLGEGEKDQDEEKTKKQGKTTSKKRI